jgi:hypothetical protein
MAYERRFVNLVINGSDLVMDLNTDPDEIVSHLLSQKISTKLPWEDFLDQAVKFFGAYMDKISSACDEWVSNPLSSSHPQAADVLHGLADYRDLFDEFSPETICLLLEQTWSSAQCSPPTISRCAVKIDLTLDAPSAVCQLEDHYIFEVVTSFQVGPLVGGNTSQTLRVNNIRSRENSPKVAA